MKTIVDALPNFAPQMADIICALCLHETDGKRPASHTRAFIDSAQGPTTFLSLLEKQLDLAAAQHFEDERDKFFNRLGVMRWTLSSGLSVDQQGEHAQALWNELRKPGRNRLLKTLYRYGAIRGVYASVPTLPPYQSEDMARLQLEVDEQLRRLFTVTATQTRPLIVEWQQRIVDIEMVSNPSGDLLGFMVGRFIGEAMRLLLSLPYPQIIEHGSSLSWIDSAPPMVRAQEAIADQVETSKGLKKIRALHQDMFLTRLSMAFDGKPWSIAVLLDTDHLETQAHWLLDGDGDIVHTFSEDLEWRDWGHQHAKRLASPKAIDALSLGRSDIRERLSNLVVNTKRWFRVHQQQLEKEAEQFQQVEDALPPINEWDGRPFPIRLATRPVHGPKLVGAAARAIKDGVEASLEAVAKFVGPCSMPVDIAQNLHMCHALSTAHADLSDYVLFRLEGGQMFQMPENLSKAIIDSGMENIPMSAVRLPHQAFYLDLGMSLLIDTQTESGNPVTIGIEGLYLRDDVSPSGTKAIVITPVLDYDTRLEELTCSRVWIPHGDGTLEDQVLLGSAEMQEAFQVKKSAVDAFIDADPTHHALDAQYNITEKLKKSEQDRRVALGEPRVCITIGRAVACLLCYLTEYQGAAVSTLLGDKSSARAQQLLDEQAGASPYEKVDWWRFGIGHVKVFKDPFHVEHDEDKEVHATGRKLIPHLRKGSFRMVAHGPHHSLRRIQWVNPYLVNTDDPRHVKQKIYDA